MHPMKIKLTFLLFFSIFSSLLSFSQSVPIINYSTDINNQVQLEINSTIEHYYILKIRHSLDSAFNLPPTSMTMGESGVTYISEGLEAYPIDHYQVLEYEISNPFDSDGDNIDDITEYNNQPFQNPLNSAFEIASNDGLVTLDITTSFNELSVLNETVQWSPYLNEKEYLKFIILNFNTSSPEVYFINTNTHPLHIDFTTEFGFSYFDPDAIKGHIIYHPTVISNNGSLGTYAFNYTNNESKPFLTVQRTQELLSTNILFLTNNLSYYINSNNELDYQSEIELFQTARIPVLFETDVFAGVNYWGLHQAEGYGFFREIANGETPGTRDIVLYQNIPNNLPHISGIITSFIQTPLSHVNLRAIQNDIPNAYIRDPLSIDTIANLLNHYIYYKVEQSGYTIREASVDEVNHWHDAKRPKNEQFPPLNLDYQSIYPLKNITFNMFDGFGAKVSNVATMGTFGFPKGTIPDGYGLPFYYYQEFMKFNDFFNYVKTMISDSDFINNRGVRLIELELLRGKIENAPIPQWMLNDFTNLQESFPKGTNIRCRSSTNNEDLPGFSGAGLYDSKTQHLDEGHISKSIKQVFASLWNLRAFEEREYYKINHYQTSMGVLFHANYSDEKVNGVGISTDPIYSTKTNFYLNSQLDNNLITNPNNNTKPEELLLNKVKSEDFKYSVIQWSSLLPNDSLLLTDKQLIQFREYLSIIHSEFATLYNATNNNSFAMDIEYKITKNDQLIIKQARPWVSYVATDVLPSTSKKCNMNIFPNPTSSYVNLQNLNQNITKVTISDLYGKLVLIKNNNIEAHNIHISLNNLHSGLYILSAYTSTKVCNTTKLIIQN